MNRSRRPPRLATKLAIVAICLTAGPLWSSSRTPAHGTPLADRAMKTADGGEARLLPRPADKKVTVLAFFRPGQKKSLRSLKRIAQVEKQLADRAVHWAAVVSSRRKPAAALADARQAGLRMKVLIDQGDQLRAWAGIIQEPCLLLVDVRGQFVRLLPFLQINQAVVLRARVLQALGELTDAQVQAEIRPPPTPDGAAANKARRHHKMAGMLLKLGNPTKALAAIERSLALDSSKASSHSRAGVILAALGDCPRAVKAFAAALAIKPKDPGARAGRAACKGRKKGAVVKIAAH